MEKYYTVIIGRDEDDYPEFLIAPEDCFFKVGDEVITKGGRTYFVKFANSYTSISNQLYKALETALGFPVKVVEKVVREEIDWGNEDETDTDTACGSDCRSREC